MPFLSEDYKEPVKSNYMTFEDGENTFRVLGEALTGWEYWTNKNVDGQIKPRPVRVKEEDQIQVGDILEGKYGPQLYFFWAFPVYNFNANRVQILVIKQKTIRRAIYGYIKNTKWGDPQNYNFVVTKIKDGDKIDYTVMPEPKEVLDSKIIERFKSLKIDMNEWFKCNDPFTAQKNENKATSKPTDINEIVSDDVADDVPF